MNKHEHDRVYNEYDAYMRDSYVYFCQGHFYRVGPCDASGEVIE